MNSHELKASKLKTADLTAIALMACVIAVCSWISVPAAVPFTMQTFAVFLAVGLLGGKRGTAAVALYLLLGTIGLPVFAGFKAGPASLIGPTGGYLLGFVFTALLMWTIELLAGRSIPALAASMIAGLIVCYAFGTLWFMAVYAAGGSDIGFMATLSMCVFPFIVPDCIKIFLACILTKKIRPLIRID